MSARGLAGIALGLASLPAVALACSGPGAMAKIEQAERVGWWLFAATVVAVLCATVVFRRWEVAWRRLWWIATPVVVHPGWWLSARGGDCGSMRLLGSIAVSAIAAVVLALALVWLGVRRRRAKTAEAPRESG